MLIKALVLVLIVSVTGAPVLAMQDGSAVATDDKERVDEFLKQHAADGMALFDAVKAEDDVLVDALVARNVHVNVRDMNSFNLLCVALRKGYLSVVKLLIKQGIKLNVINHFGTTPLHAALSSAELVELKLVFVPSNTQKNINKDVWHNVNVYNALWSHEDMVRELLVHGANPCIENKAGCTPAASAHTIAVYLANQITNTIEIEKFLRLAAFLRWAEGEYGTACYTRACKILRENRTESDLEDEALCNEIKAIKTCTAPGYKPVLRCGCVIS